MLFDNENLKTMPPLYEQDGKGDEAIVHIVVSIPNTKYVWLLEEYSPKEGIFFGFTCINDIQCAELGYISKAELESLSKNCNLVVEKVNMTLQEAKKKYIG